MIAPAFALALLLQASAADPSAAPHWPALGEAAGGRWVCDAEHERERQADLELLKVELPKGLKGAGAELPQLEAALAHAPAEPVGGSVTCDGRTFAFNPTASLLALAAAANRHEPAAVDPRPMPYARLALLVGSLHNEGGRYDRALAALDRGLAMEPFEPSLAGEKAYTLVHIGRSAEAVALCADAIAADGGAEKPLVAHLHRLRGFALGEMGRYDDAIAEYRASQALDPAETGSANEITYLEGRKAGRGPSRERSTTMDQIRKPQG